MSIEVNNLMNLADGQVLYNDLRNRQEDIVKVSDTQPTSPDNKIWIDTDSNSEVEVPTYDDISALQIIKNAAGALGAAGSAASFSDGANGVPVKNCIVDFYPYQDLHGQDNPYPAGGGKNKAPVNSFTAIHDTVMTFSPDLPSGEYTYSYKATRTGSDQRNGAIRFVYDDDTYLQEYIYVDGTRKNKTATFEKPLASIYVYSISGSYADSGNFELTATDFQIESGSTATAYSPYSNICPITGWTGVNVSRTGVNVWDEEWEAGSYDANGAEIVSQGWYRTKNYISVIPNETYFSKRNAISGTPYIRCYDINKQFTEVISFPKDNTFTIPANCHYIRFSFSYSYDNSISINYPSTDTDYHPYSGATYSISWETEAGTVYGGSLNVTTGVLTVEWVRLNLGDCSWNKASQANTYFYVVVSNGTANGTINVAATNVYSSAIPIIARRLINQTAGSEGMAVEEDTSQKIIAIYICIQSMSGYTKEQFREAMDGYYISYQLAEPQTYQLTPVQILTLLGQNNIWANTGDIAVDYCVDTKTYVDANAGVKDVQVNGTSIVQDGVADIPKATSSSLGVVRTLSDRGTGISASTGALEIVPASDSQIQNGGSAYRSAATNKQHKSVFYGLAKASGDTTQSSSSNAVGIYTESALSKISDMLNAPVSVSGATPTINAMSGVRYICGEVTTLTINPPAGGDIEVIFDSGSTATVLTITPPTGVTAVRWANGFDPTSLDANTTYDLIITDGKLGVAASWA